MNETDYNSTLSYSPTWYNNASLSTVVNDNVQNANHLEKK